ncbi:MAG: membrane protein insertase YidC [Clostridiales bacterium]|nr:membrane protein insertase YidC [Clostridiales bacterium]
MDKNTLIGMLLMAAVIFGFMYLQPKPDQAAESARQEQVARREREAREEEARKAAILDSIRPAEVADMANTIVAVGVAADTQEGGATAYTYNTAGVTLVSQDGKVSGTVDAMGTRIDYNAVVTSQFPDSLSLQQKQAAVASLRGAMTNAAKYQTFARHLAGTDTVVSLRNEVLSLNISTKGGYINNAQLLDHRYCTYFENKEGVIDTAQVEVIQPIAQDYFAFELNTGLQRIDTRDLYFTPVVENDSTVLMQLDLGAGAKWGLRYTLGGRDSYVVKLDIVQENIDKILPPATSTTAFIWNQRLARNERGRMFEQQNSAIYYKEAGEGPDDLGMKHGEKQLDQRVQWLAFKNQFFSTIVIPREPFNAASLKQRELADNNDPYYLKDMNARATLDYSTSSDNPVSLDIFIGPNLYPLLSGVDDEVAPGESLELTRVIPLGWALFRWINTIIIIPVFTFLSQFISNYGIIILLLTIFIKIILFPFTYKSYMSQARMRVLAPEIKEINEKYPGNENAMTRQQKTMALYSRAGASPMSGCLPMLLQMPILFAMFKFFPSCIELRGQQFLWAQDLAAPDVIFTLPFTIPMYGNHVSLFCLLMTVTNILYTRINMQNQPSGASMPAMKWMMYLMPVMFLVFFNQYAAGLSYYYFLSLLITIIQTYIFRRCINEKKVRERMMASAAKPRKKSGFMARLEEAQRRQQAMLREQQKKGGRR